MGKSGLTSGRVVNSDIQFIQLTGGSNVMHLVFVAVPKRKKWHTPDIILQIM
jgi:hypothetical protein